MDVHLKYKKVQPIRTQSTALDVTAKECADDRVLLAPVVVVALAEGLLVGKTLNEVVDCPLKADARV